MPVEATGLRPVEHHDLATAGVRVLRVGRRLAIEAQVAAGELHQAVGLRGHHVAAVGQADVERLAASPQRQEEVIRVRGGAGADGHRALEGRHRVAEGVGQVGPLCQSVGDEGGDHLGVGGDLGGQPETVGRLQVGEVVHVAVQGGRHVRAGRAVHLEAVDRVGVGLGDDPDARPPGVAQHDSRGTVTRQRQAEEVVGLQISPHGSGVVAQLADLGGRLVDEAEVALHHAHGVGAEELVVGPVRQQAGHRRDPGGRGRGRGPRP